MCKDWERVRGLGAADAERQRAGLAISLVAALLKSPDEDDRLLLVLCEAAHKGLMHAGRGLAQLEALGLRGERRERTLLLLGRLSRLRAGLSSARPPRPSAREVKQIHRETMQVVDWLTPGDSAEPSPRPTGDSKS